MNALTSEKGFSMMEVLISTALGALVLAGAFDVYVSSTKSLLNQTDDVQMQADTKAAMDYMLRELRTAVTAYAPLSITTTLAPNDTITFARGEASGFSSSNNNTAITLTDAVGTIMRMNPSGTISSQPWQVNQFAPTAAAGAYSVWIKTGTGVGQLRPIQSNTATTLTVSPAWTIIPDTTSLYFIVRTKTFTRLADNTLRYNINGGTTYLLAQNVTALSLSVANPCDATIPTAATVCVTLNARSKNLDHLTGKYKTYTLTNTVHPRN